MVAFKVGRERVMMIEVESEKMLFFSLFAFILELSFS